MGLRDRRSNIKRGRYSIALTLPAKMEVGKESTLATNRLVLVDPRGEIHEDDLLQFLETFIEPKFWPWLEELRKRKKEDRTSNE